MQLEVRIPVMPHQTQWAEGNKFKALDITPQTN
jgi:hypothetical protein